MNFSQVMEKNGISRNDLFRYFQVRDFIMKDTLLLADVNVTQIEKQVLLSQGDSGLRELGVVITEEMWDDIWDNARKITVCNRTRAMELKTLHRAHVAPNRLSKYRKDVAPLCL